MSKFYDFEAEDVMCNMHKMEEYQEQGFEILDFPCNQFGNQAPGTNEEMELYYFSSHIPRRQ